MKVQHFISHINNIKSRKGKLIVIEGGDGSGKATQAELLVSYLKSNGVKVKYYDFPRYYSSFHGKFIGRFLSGEFGKLADVSPYLASLAYALDRASVREEMEEWLRNGGTIICNRYVTSSMAHQAGRLPGNERKDFTKWLDELEYKQHKMPRPNFVIYLYVPWKIGMELTAKKVDTRGYTKKADIAERDINHRVASENMYLSLASERRNWMKIDSVDSENKLLSKEIIHQKIVDVLKKHGAI